MFLLGGTLTKLLAAVVAVLTVTTGMPRAQCVCPDGRVKLFCAGSPATGCCCATPDSNVGAGDHSPRKHACCAHAAQSRPTSQTGDGPALAAGACGCERTAVDASPQYAPEDDGGSARAEFATALAWNPSPFVAERPVRRAAVRWGVHCHPPDLVVLFCHFTC